MVLNIDGDRNLIGTISSEWHRIYTFGMAFTFEYFETVNLFL
jgi:hypothetical protein